MGAGSAVVLCGVLAVSGATYLPSRGDRIIYQEDPHPVLLPPAPPKPCPPPSYQRFFSYFSCRNSFTFWGSRESGSSEFRVSKVPSHTRRQAWGGG